MTEATFWQLAPFIQEYIYQHGWTELREIQTAACGVIFQTDHHLLLAAGTSSGKTEAAFLPIITLVYRQPRPGVAAMYIGPIKALINDQFDRLRDLLKTADIPVFAWHGDVTAGQKNTFLRCPRGILQITPESLESLLINRYGHLQSLFANLQFVVIDEIHAFMGTQRGSQILCQLKRLSDITQNSHRRIGLSATLGDYGLAQEWLGAGTDRPVAIASVTAQPRRIQIGVEHFFVEEGHSPHYQYLFEQTQGYKSLIFANDRRQAEAVISNLRRLAGNTPDIYHVHHGSISAQLRRQAEIAMLTPDQPAITAATVSLEMGIDIGYLERVFQIEAPNSVASFLQRLGRSGRRGEPANMRFICTEPNDTKPLPIPWSLLQCVAVIQLYLEEKWLEPLSAPRYPLTLLYQQTLASLRTELTRRQLQERVLSLPAFGQITPADFQQFIDHLVLLDHLTWTEQGKLILGQQGAKIAQGFSFYAVFSDDVTYTVKWGDTEIGTVAIAPPVGGCFALAGRTWQVQQSDRYTLWVEPTVQADTLVWQGSGSPIHTKILQKMRQILLSQQSFPYLKPPAQKRLRIARHWARRWYLDQGNLFALDERTYCLLPWLGTRGYRTLEKLLFILKQQGLGIRAIGGRPPYFFTFRLVKTTPKEFLASLIALAGQELAPENLISWDEVPRLEKYDQFMPPGLLAKAYAHDHLDLAEVAAQPWN
jgi:ATP-dependent Lhr-like helicase